MQLGHLALGYFSADLLSRFTKEKFDIPVVWIVSILPDIDLLFNHYIAHRGPTHSIIVACVLSIPILLKYRRGYSYFASLISHSLIGDYFTSPHFQLLWPITPGLFGADYPFQLNGSVLLVVELGLVILMLFSIIFKKRRDHNLIQNTNSIFSIFSKLRSLK